MHPEYAHFGRGHAREDESQHYDEQRALHDVGHRCGGMLEIGASVGDVGNRQERGLRRNAADSIGKRKFGVAVGSRGDRGDGTGERSAGAEEDRSGQCLSESGALRDAVCRRCKLPSRNADQRRRGREHCDVGGKGQLRKIV